MRSYFDEWRIDYHFENVYRPALVFSKIYLHQAGEMIARDGFILGDHEQYCMEISYVVSGSCDFYSDGKVFHAKQGDIHVVTKGMHHKIEVKENETFRMAYIAFSFREGLSGMDELVDFYLNPPLALCNDTHLSRILFEQLLYEIYTSQAYSFEAMDDYATQILIHVYRIFQEGGISDSQRFTEDVLLSRVIGHTVLKMLRYIDTNISEVKGISQIAEELQYSPAYLSRLFKEKTGVPVHHYIETKKVEVAKEFLKGDMSVGQIALRLGYASSHSFCKMFSRHVGCSPSAFRKENKRHSH